MLSQLWSWRLLLLGHIFHALRFLIAPYNFQTNENLGFHLHKHLDMKTWPLPTLTNISSELMGFVRPQSWGICECTRISTFPFFSGVIFWLWWCQRKAKTPGTQIMPKVEGRERIPLLQLKRIWIYRSFKGILWAGVGRGLGTQHRTLLQHLLWKRGPEQHPAGGSQPFTKDSASPFPGCFSKTKDALYVQTASAKKNKLKRCLFFPGKPMQILTITTLDLNSCEIIKEGDTATLGLKSWV